MPANDLPSVTLYTDGACLGNPGPGGYGVLLISGNARKELSAGYRLTTNNRMEILAVITGLRALGRRSRVTVYSDSKYVVDAMSLGWVKGWRARGWKKSDGSRALNADLWAELWDLCQEHEVTFQWVKGHAGHPENELCDRLSVAAAKGKNLPDDQGYLTGGHAPTDDEGAASGASQQALFASAQSHAPATSGPRRTSAASTASTASTAAPTASTASTPAPDVASAAFVGKPVNRVATVRAGASALTLTFADERELRIPLAWYPALAAASPAARAEYAIEDDGRVVSFPRVGVTIAVADMLGQSDAPHG